MFVFFQYLQTLNFSQFNLLDVFSGEFSLAPSFRPQRHLICILDFVPTIMLGATLLIKPHSFKIRTLSQVILCLASSQTFFCLVTQSLLGRRDCVTRLRDEAKESLRGGYPLSSGTSPFLPNKGVPPPSPPHFT